MTYFWAGYASGVLATSATTALVAGALIYWRRFKRTKNRRKIK